MRPFSSKAPEMKRVKTQERRCLWHKAVWMAIVLSAWLPSGSTALPLWSNPLGIVRDALSNADATPTPGALGLPRVNHCAVAFNNTLYIMQGIDVATGRAANASVSLVFNPNDNLQNAPAANWIGGASNASNAALNAPACLVTSYGVATVFSSTVSTLALVNGTWNALQSPVGSNTTRAVGTAALTGDQFLIVAADTTSGKVSTWLLDASSSDETQWAWTTVSPSKTAVNLNLDAWFVPLQPDQGSNALVALSSYTLFFSVDIQHQKTTIFCFDNSRQRWLGELLNINMTSSVGVTNAVQPQWIQAGADNDTVVVIPSWTYPAPSSPSFSSSSSFSFYMLNISTQNAKDGNLPTVGLWTVQQSSFQPVIGGSVTPLFRWLLFYGGAPVSASSSHKKRAVPPPSSSSTSTSFQFWSIDTQQFLATPSWVTTMTNPPNVAPSSPATASSAASSAFSSYSHTLVIILAVLLGVFGAAFVCMAMVMIWRHRRRQKYQHDAPRPRDIDDARERMNRTSDQVDDDHDERGLPTPDGGMDATTWSSQLQRALSGIFRRKSSKKRPRWVISPPLESMQEVRDDSSPTETRAVVTPGTDASSYTHQLPDTNSTTHIHATNTVPSSSQSPRTSWYEGSNKASRFVEHF